MARRLLLSTQGRALLAIREDEDAIRSLGKNVFAIKMQALIIGGMLAALGGMAYILAGSMQADQFGRSLTFFAYTALLIGGAATIFGPVLGAVIFYSARIMIKGLEAMVIESFTTDVKVIARAAADPPHEDAGVVDTHRARDAGQRGERLTRQLLAFSRNQELKLEVVDVGALLDQAEPSLRALQKLAVQGTPILKDLRAASPQLARLAGEYAAPAARVTGLMNLGKGTALAISSPGMSALRETN